MIAFSTSTFDRDDNKSFPRLSAPPQVLPSSPGPLARPLQNFPNSGIDNSVTSSSVRVGKSERSDDDEEAVPAEEELVAAMVAV